MINAKILMLLTIFMVPFVHAQTISMATIQRFQNDKEVEISSFSKRQISNLEQQFDEDYRKNLSSLFQDTLLEFLNTENACELKLIRNFYSNLEKKGLATDEQSVEQFLKVLRIENTIDDILYEILSSNNKDHFGLQAVDMRKFPGRRFSKNEELIKQNDLKELYSNFEVFPDEDSLCAYQEFIFLKKSIKSKDGKRSEKPLKDMSVLNKVAFEQKLISLDSYHKLEYLRNKSDLSKRIILLKDYVRIILNAKNRMIPVTRVYSPVNLKDEDKFSSERMKRFSHLTRRKLLYKKYDETQIILLAQVLQKASRRMGVDPDTQSGIPYIGQEFTVTKPDGNRETYVERFELDPQSQFNLARRLMRKDIIDLQMMDVFNGLKITYEDVVMAGFETGYISIEDLTYVVRYDDLWNPERSKFERVSGFVFKVAGYSTFFLPPPWNIIGTVALGVVEGIVDRKFSNGADNDNPATFIE